MVLDQGTRETGGRYDTLLTARRSTATMKQLADELTHQYRVTYARPQTLIPPERVTIAAAKAGADRARHRAKTAGSVKR